MSQDALRHAATDPLGRRAAVGSAQSFGLSRIGLGIGLLAVAAVTYGVTAPATVATLEPELARLMRAMVLIKGLMALGAVTFVFWRLGRPVRQATAGGYLLTAVALTAAVVWLWNLTNLLLAAVLFYGSLVGLLVIAHADKDLFGDRDRIF